MYQKFFRVISKSTFITIPNIHWSFFYYTCCCIIIIITLIVAVADHRGRHFVTSFLGLNSPLSPEILIVPQVKHGAVNVSIHSISGGVLTHRHLTVQPGTSRVVTVESGIRMIAGKLEKKGNKSESYPDRFKIITGFIRAKTSDGFHWWNYLLL